MGPECTSPTGRNSTEPSDLLRFLARCPTWTPPGMFGAPRCRPTPTSPTRTLPTLPAASSHYTDFDCKVMSYAAELSRQETNRRAVRRSRDYTSDYKVARQYNTGRNYPEDSFSSRYDYYDGNKHGSDGLYPCSKDVLGTWKHYNLSAETLAARNTRARSPLQSRELDRYFETRKRVNYIG